MIASPLSRQTPTWEFVYYSGCGNLFLIAYDPDALHQRLSSKQLSFLSQSTNQTVDGLLFLEGKKDHLRMHYYNRDGTRASMCGNGLRCLGHFAHLLFYDQLPAPFFIETDVGLRSLQVNPTGLVTTDMGNIPLISEPIPNWFFCNTGVPHAISFLSALPSGPIDSLALPIRSHSVFHPHGTNVSFAQLKRQQGESHLFLRTFERGVEGETGACGTGASAAACIAHTLFDTSYPITIHFYSQEKATVSKKDSRLFLTAACQVLQQLSLTNPLSEVCSTKAPSTF